MQDLKQLQSREYSRDSHFISLPTPDPDVQQRYAETAQRCIEQLGSRYRLAHPVVKVTNHKEK